YVKDLSFELSDAPNIFTGEGAQSLVPVMRTNLSISNEKMAGDEYEVSVRLTVHATREGGGSVFLVEVLQAGIFVIADAGERELQRLLNVQCPEAIFPFARETIWSAVTRGGVPHLLLQDIDFGSLFDQAHS
ncbi:MAG: protein-export chaperone SecB, partial [Gammaproteobacteria bacterium]